MGSIAGCLFLRGPAGDFPTTRWSDFPVIVLGWWVPGLTSLVVGETRSFQGLFMEGPFAFVVERGIGASGRIAWGHRGNEVSIGIVDTEMLLQSAIFAGRRVAEACHTQSWTSGDLDDLEKAIAQGERSARP
jgi:hypothetical protein